MPTITPFLWFDDDLEEALDLYTGLFPDARIVEAHRTPDGKLFYGTFTLAGQTFFGMNGGPGHPHTDAFSVFVMCEDQAEVDRYWDALTADGGAEGRCGWCTDRFGLSWQIVPSEFGELMSGGTPEQSARVREAMFTMSKLDVVRLRAAYDG